MTHLSLFTGIGGLDLAAEWAGFETVGQCEFADYPHEVLCRHWPDVPKWRDIRTLTKEGLYERTGLRTVDVISGGFPCQPFSTAGKRRGRQDDRYLWPEMLRVIQEIKPRWVVGENVSGVVRDALDEILKSLEQAQYTAWAYSFKASEVGALFAGDRIAILASSNDRCTTMRRNIQFQTNAEFTGCRDYYRGGAQEFDAGQWWKLESRPYGVAHGVPNRVDRIRCLGNAVVPQQFYPVFQAIAEVMKGVETT
ncbi:MAG: DNA (cytosine-5-)-methyltransferase [Clostridiales bacterium]|jgi:DNA (cytosine-5)-methyltransferase 1|nr:DNA (cytosine-5-)-methyltransferase [Clostridiales bacterium]